MIDLVAPSKKCSFGNFTYFDPIKQGTDLLGCSITLPFPFMLYCFWADWHCYDLNITVGCDQPLLISSLSDLFSFLHQPGLCCCLPCFLFCILNIFYHVYHYMTASKSLKGCFSTVPASCEPKMFLKLFT